MDKQRELTTDSIPLCSTTSDRTCAEPLLGYLNLTMTVFSQRLSLPLLRQKLRLFRFSALPVRKPETSRCQDQLTEEVAAFKKFVGFSRFGEGKDLVNYGFEFPFTHQTGYCQQFACPPHH